VLQPVLALFQIVIAVSFPFRGIKDSMKGEGQFEIQPDFFVTA